MCGRFTLRTPAGRLIDHFESEFPDPIEARYNIAPTQPVLAVRVSANGGMRMAVPLRWGLVPSWAKDPSIGYRMINARGETVSEKPAFRAAFRRRRCLIPADGYFEWKKIGSIKQPYLIRLSGHEPFGMAGLWESWRDRETGRSVETCTIITTDANSLTRPVHDRMPVILAPHDYARWLDPAVQDADDLTSLLRPHQAAGLCMEPVSTYVNSPRNDDLRCTEPVDGAPPL